MANGAKQMAKVLMVFLNEKLCRFNVLVNWQHDWQRKGEMWCNGQQIASLV